MARALSALVTLLGLAFLGLTLFARRGEKLDEPRDDRQSLLFGFIDMDLRFARLQQAAPLDRKSTRLNSSHIQKSRMPSSA